MIAALYVDRHGPYFGRPDVDPWGAERDAKKYWGPHPIVAHPPCGPWGHLRHLSRGDDRTCAIRAVYQVQAFGGVLEHPCWSKLFPHMQLPYPGELPDAFGGRTIEVCQCDWGHVARKRTWLYMVRVRDVGWRPTPREPTHWVSGGRAKPGRKSTPVPPGIKVCSAQQRRRTPPAFADWLIGLAESVNRRAA